MVTGCLDGVTLMHTAAHARVFAFRVFAHDDPVQVFRLAPLQWRINAGQDAGGTHIGILVKALADFEAQSPQGDVIRNGRVTGRPEEDGIFATQGVQSVGGHHLAVGAVPVATPAKVFKLKTEGGAGRSQRFQHSAARWHHFLANAVTRNTCDLVRLHKVSKTGCDGRRMYLLQNSMDGFKVTSLFTERE
jgi:hypothetical protein